jgi:hypothetical protein
MEECKRDVQMFNNKVNEILKQLRARRSDPGDILTNLLDAYKACEDKGFVEYVQRKEEMHEENSIPLTLETIMRMALDKYEVLVEKDEWMKKNSQELEFIAMKPELKETKKKLEQIKRQPNAKSRIDGSSGGYSAPCNTGKFAWKSITSATSEPHKKTFEGRNYIYCPHHGETKWVLETNRCGIKHVDGCNEKKKKTRNDDSTAASTTTANQASTPYTPSKEQMSYARALASVMEEDVSAVTEDEELPMNP